VGQEENVCFVQATVKPDPTCKTLR